MCLAIGYENKKDKMNGGFFSTIHFILFLILQDFLSVAHYDHISLLLSRMLYSLENQSGSE